MHTNIYDFAYIAKMLEKNIYYYIYKYIYFFHLAFYLLKNEI